MTSKYTIHRYCAAFPDIQGEERERLKEDIKDNGQRQPCIVYGKELIDGKNRESICLELGIKPRYEEFIPKSSDPDEIDDEIFELVISVNQMRRHDTVSDRAMTAAVLADLPHGGDRKSADQDAGMHLDRAEIIAKRFGISVRSIASARNVQNNATDEVIEAVKAHDITVNDADKVAKLPAREQKAAVKAVKAGKAKTATAAVKSRAERLASPTSAAEAYGAGKKKPSKKKSEPREPGEDPQEPEHDVPVDADGTTIPEPLREIFSFKDAFYTAERSLANIGNVLYAATEPLNLNRKEIDSLRLGMWTYIHNHWPYRVCKKCHGGKCQSCKGRGYTVKGT